MDTWLQFVIAALAVYRVSRMVATEEGPFSIFAKFRRLSLREGEDWFSRGVHCPICISFWAGLLAAMWFMGKGEPTGPTSFVMVWLALSGAATLIYRYFN